MRIIGIFYFLLFTTIVFAQDTLQMPHKNNSIKDASYSGGGMEELYYYVNNNYNYNNVKKSDVPKAFVNHPFFIFYIVFAISEDGKAFDFSAKEITEDNSFYKEAVRVIASARWNIATKDQEYKKQYLVLPFKAMIND